MTPGEGATSADIRGSTRAPAVVAAVLAVLVLIGSAGAWTTAAFVPTGEVSVGGLDGDGRTTLGLGLVALVGVFVLAAQPRIRSWMPWALASEFRAAAGIGLVDWTDVRTMGEASDPLELFMQPVPTSQPVLLNVG